MSVYVYNLLLKATTVQLRGSQKHLPWLIVIYIKIYQINEEKILFKKNVRIFIIFIIILTFIVLPYIYVLIFNDFWEKNIESNFQ